MNAENKTTETLGLNPGPNSPSIFNLFVLSLVEMIPPFLRGWPSLLIVALLTLEFGAGLLARKPYTMMWEVSDGVHTGHVLGTLHAGKASFYPLDPAIETAFAQSGVLSLEIDSNEADSPDPVPNRISSKGDLSRRRQLDLQRLVLSLRQDRNLWSAYSAKSFHDRVSIVHKLYDNRPGSLESFDHFDLWMDIVELGGYSFRDGIDLYFYRRAKNRKPVVAAEPSALHEEYLEVAQKDVSQFFDPFDPDSLEQEIQTTAEACLTAWDEWNRGVVRKLDKSDEDYEIMVRRNRAMATTFVRLLQEDQRPFMAVGAGHMGGSKGLIALLRARGLSAKRVLREKQGPQN